MMIQMKNGPQNAYMPLQAMPSAAPHIELPLYQNDEVGDASCFTAQHGQQGEHHEQLENACGRLADGDADAVVDEDGAKAGNAPLEAPTERCDEREQAADERFGAHGRKTRAADEGACE